VGDGSGMKGSTTTYQLRLLLDIFTICQFVYPQRSYSLLGHNSHQSFENEASLANFSAASLVKRSALNGYAKDKETINGLYISENKLTGPVL